MRVRTRRWTGWPTASHMRRTWRLRPSWITRRRTPGASTPTSAGAVGPSSSSTPSRRARNAPGGGVPPATSATYSLATPWEGCVSSWASAPSLVRISRPSVWRSRRPTGKTRGSAGTRSSTVRPALGVVGRGDHVVGLVQEVVHEVRRHRHQDAVDLDPGGRRVDAAPEHGDARRRPSRARPRSAPRRRAASPSPARASTFWSRSPSAGPDALRRRRRPASTPRPSADCSLALEVARPPRARAGSPPPAGSCSSESRPSRSRKRSVVPKSAGWPGPSA